MTRDRVEAAYQRIRPFIRRTPLLIGDRGGRFGPAEVTFKLEMLQQAGSFKARGAFNHLLSRPVPPVGVTAASGGNHGAAVALAAQRLGHRAHIFVPEISAPVKIARIRSYGAEIIVGGARYADAQAACDRHAAETGALLVHPFDAEATVEGAGTVALEWEEEAGRRGLPPLHSVLVAVGGGGLIAGIASWWRGRVKVVGVEPEGSRCLHAALEAGAPVDVSVESIAADSLGARRAGNIAFAIAREAVDRVVLVSDDAIRAAQTLLWDEYRMLVEPGGAASLAALLQGSYSASPGEHVGVLLCGGNVDPRLVPTLVQ
jgi:threonine dehydratase